MTDSIEEIRTLQKIVELAKNLSPPSQRWLMSRLKDVEWADSPLSESREGWGFPVVHGTRSKAHYFRDGLSLCGRHATPAGELEQNEDESPDDCVFCRKRLHRAIA